MPTTTVYPISTITGDWTPSTPGPNHHLLVDEAVPDTSDFIEVAGFTGMKIETFGLGTVPADCYRITKIRIKQYANAATITNLPACRASIYLNNVNIVSFEGGLPDTGTWINLSAASVTLNIPGSVWNSASPLSQVFIRFTPLDGSALSLPTFTTE